MGEIPRRILNSKSKKQLEFFWNQQKDGLRKLAFEDGEGYNAYQRGTEEVGNFLGGIVLKII